MFALVRMRMKNKLFLLGASALLLCLVTINSCKKDEESLPLEPIYLVSPDSAIVRMFAGDSLPLEIVFTTDRPINWIKGMMDINTTPDSLSYVATYGDTAFLVALDTLDPRVNRYTYKSTYFIPDTLQPFDVIRFRISFEAGSSTFQVGQNYPQGKVSSTKEFRIDVR